MELSNYQAFMECMRKWEKIGCNILCGLALWEQMQDCDRRGVPYLPHSKYGIVKERIR